MAADEKHIDDLIAKYLANEASLEEQELLWLWMDQSEENKKYFGDIQFVHDQAIAFHPYKKINTDKAWATVRGKMKKQDLPQQASKHTIGMYWMRIAASILLLGGCGILLYTLLHKPLPSTLAYSFHSTDRTVSRTIAGTTRITLNRNSCITFRKHKKEKELILSGEAFIQITHSPDTVCIVKAGKTFIRDIGTSFNVKAYPESSRVEVYVENGEVAFYTDKQSGISLTKGETGRYDKNSKTFRKLSVSDPNTSSYESHIFIFKDTPLSKVIEQINGVYPDHITIGNPALENCSITVTFENETISSIVDIIAETLGLSVTRSADGYILNGERCNNHP